MPHPILWSQRDLLDIIAQWTPPPHCRVYADVHRRYAVITLYHRAGCTAWRRWPRHRAVEHVATLLEMLAIEMKIEHRECLCSLPMQLAMEAQLTAAKERFYSGLYEPLMSARKARRERPKDGDGGVGWMRWYT